MMRETDDDLEALQNLLDVSFARSGEHLRSAFDQEHRLPARTLDHKLEVEGRGVAGYIEPRALFAKAARR